MCWGEGVHFYVGYLYEVVKFDFVIVSGKSGRSNGARGREDTTAYGEEGDSDDVEGLPAGEFEQN